MDPITKGGLVISILNLYPSGLTVQQINQIFIEVTGEKLAPTRLEAELELEHMIGVRRVFNKYFVVNPIQRYLRNRINN